MCNNIFEYFFGVFLWYEFLSIEGAPGRKEPALGLNKHHQLQVVPCMREETSIHISMKCNNM